jgi:CubicO group peptidase (beta-lactamase class C family)
VLVVAGVLAVPVAARPVAKPVKPAKAVPAYVARMRTLVPGLMARQNVPAVAIAVIRRGRVEWSGGFGSLDDGTRVTSSTVFQAASLGKPLFGRAVLSLAARRLLHLDVPLLRYLRGTDHAGLDLGRATPRMVLNHTSGIALGHGDERYALEFAPGARWKYSGAGTVVLQRAAEHATGHGLDAILSAAVLKRLGMASTSYVWSDAYASRAAVGHTRSGSALAHAPAKTASAASSLLTTAADYARFVAATLSEAGPQGPRVFRQMFRAAVPVDPKLGLSWGLGWALEARRGGQQCFFHWGANPGFRAFALGCPADGSGIVILTNGDNGLELAEPIVGVVDRSAHPVFQFYMLHPDD